MLILKLVYIFIVGLALGSFVNALVWRLYNQEFARKKSKKHSILKGRSVCTHCGHKLASKDLIPVVSWLSLKGKCRYCHKPIEDSPIVELSTGAVAVLSYIYWPYGQGDSLSDIVLFAVWMLILAMMMALVVFDIKWQLLPTKVIYAMGVFSVGFVIILALRGSLPDVITGAVVGSVVLGGAFYLLHRLGNGKWLGDGDYRLGFVIGALAGGLAGVVWLVFIASLLGTIYSLPIILKSKQVKMQIPFGPFLIIATITIVLFGSSLETHLINLLFPY